MIEERFTIASLAEGKTALVEITPVPGATAAALATLLHEGSGGIGIAIENFAAFPDTDDYREHEFYRSNFTSSEIEYCLGQPSIKGAFAKLWAAKEAVIKSEAAKAPPDGLAAIEISCDKAGKPSYPGCLISIGHADPFVVAVSFWPGSLALASAAKASQAEPAKPAVAVPPTFGTRVLAAAGFLAMLFVFGAGLWMILSMLFRS